ncbi:MAG: helix-turn-helix transcriptional regulator [Mycolicibacterium sp.]|nr:helix-turn-helix transcriptional regulator [Mycolicibacterium sp.]
MDSWAVHPKTPSTPPAASTSQTPPPGPEPPTNLRPRPLALRSGVSRNVLIDVETGRRGLLYERLFDIADALEVPVADLLPE